MDKKELSELQSEETWEFGDDVETPDRKRKARAVVSVSFPGEDFERVDRYAEGHGLTLSELIRRATLSYVSAQRAAAKTTVGPMSAGGPDQMTAYFREMSSATLAPSVESDVELARP